MASFGFNLKFHPFDPAIFSFITFFPRNFPWYIIVLLRLGLHFEWVLLFSLLILLCIFVCYPFYIESGIGICLGLCGDYYILKMSNPGLGLSLGPSSTYITLCVTFITYSITAGL